MVPQYDSEREELLTKAMEAVRAAIPAAEADPARPTFHYRPPAQWMNDPNGPIFIGGWYHLFYQFNPYGDQWGNMHWGHARSEDLVHWEELPIALWPSKSKGEDHVFSGSTYRDASGMPRIFYTSISGSRPPEQWTATPVDGELIHWEKPEFNPVVSEKTLDATQIDEWRDPFIFRENNEVYMLTGGAQEGLGVVAIFRAQNGELTDWEYVGIFFSHPTASLIECPNLARIDGRYVLFISIEGRVDAIGGEIDSSTMRFVAENETTVEDGSYASQLVRKADGRWVHLAWVRMNEHRGWNGVMALPNDLSLSSSGQLVTKPVKALERLRGEKITMKNGDLMGQLDLSPHVKGNALEVIAEIDLRKSTSIRFELSDTAAAVYDVASRTLTIPNRRPLVIRGTEKGGSLKLHFFLDRTVMDVYADDYTVAATSSVELGDPERGLRIFAIGGYARIKSLTAYELRPATFDLSRYK